MTMSEATPTAPPAPTEEGAAGDNDNDGDEEDGGDEDDIINDGIDDSNTINDEDGNIMPPVPRQRHGRPRLCRQMRSHRVKLEDAEQGDESMGSTAPPRPAPPGHQASDKVVPHWHYQQLVRWWYVANSTKEGMAN